MSKRNHFIERSIIGGLAFFRESVFADEYASIKGFMQSRDPRFKVLAILLMLIMVLIVKNTAFIIAMYFFCLLLACSSGIKLGFFLKRTWIFIPLFTVFIAIPSIFSVFTPGAKLAAFNILGYTLIITREGLAGSILFVMRVAASVSLAVLLTLTTRHTELLRVLRIFRIPQIFVMILGMCYRYIYLFVEIIGNTYMAIKSRVGFRVHYRKGQEIVTWSMANLWQRSYQLNSEVYNAMLSRGYSGEPKTLDEFSPAAGDWVWIVFVIMSFVIVVVLNISGKI